MVPAAEVTGDPRGARFDQAAGEQHRLSPGIAPVTVAGYVFLLSEIERLASLRADNEFISLRFETWKSRDSSSRHRVGATR